MVPNPDGAIIDIRARWCQSVGCNSGDRDRRWRGQAQSRLLNRNRLPGIIAVAGAELLLARAICIMKVSILLSISRFVPLDRVARETVKERDLRATTKPMTLQQWES